MRHYNFYPFFYYTTVFLNLFAFFLYCATHFIIYFYLYAISILVILLIQVSVERIFYYTYSKYRLERRYLSKRYSILKLITDCIIDKEIFTEKERKQYNYKLTELEERINTYNNTIRPLHVYFDYIGFSAIFLPILSRIFYDVIINLSLGNFYSFFSYINSPIDIIIIVLYLGAYSFFIWAYFIAPRSIISSEIKKVDHEISRKYGFRDSIEILMFAYFMVKYPSSIPKWFRKQFKKFNFIKGVPKPLRNNIVKSPIELYGKLIDAVKNKVIDTSKIIEGKV